MSDGELLETPSGIAIPRTDAGHPVVYITTSVPGLAWHAQGDPEEFLERYLAFKAGEEESFAWDDPIHGDRHFMTRAVIPHLLTIGRGYTQRLTPVKSRLVRGRSRSN